MLEGSEKDSWSRPWGAREGRLVDELDSVEFIDVFDLSCGGCLISDDAEVTCEVVVNNGVGEGGFSGARDAGEGYENAEGKIDLQVLDVVCRGARDFKVGLGIAVFFRNGNRSLTEEIGKGV
jgi:hypothetical protein